MYRYYTLTLLGAITAVLAIVAGSGLQAFAASVPLQDPCECEATGECFINPSPPTCVDPSSIYCDELNVESGTCNLGEDCPTASQCEFGVFFGACAPSGSTCAWQKAQCNGTYWGPPSCFDYGPGYIGQCAHTALAPDYLSCDVRRQEQIKAGGTVVVSYDYGCKNCGE